MAMVVGKRKATASFPMWGNVDTEIAVKETLKLPSRELDLTDSELAVIDIVTRFIEQN